MSPLVTALADSWSSLYSNSAALRSALSFTHIGGLLGGGGCALAADRGVLLAYRGSATERVHHAQGLHRVHRVVLAGLTAVIISGALLALADLESYVASWVFWLKMALVLILLANGALLTRAGQQAAAGSHEAWRALRLASVASLVLWFATTLVGAVLPNVL